MWDFFKILQVMSGQTSLMYCNCIVTRGGVYDEILPEPEENPEGRARGISQGLIVYPNSSRNTVILNYLRM